MKMLSLAVCYTALVILVSCNKTKSEPQPTDVTYSASYANDVFKVTKGTKFTSASLEHNFPSGVQFQNQETHHPTIDTL